MSRYNENQYSLPRWEDLSVSRQTMYDNTYHFIPTQGWMFLPLVVYHGGKFNQCVSTQYYFQFLLQKHCLINTIRLDNLNILYRHDFHLNFVHRDISQINNAKHLQ